MKHFIGFVLFVAMIGAIAEFGLAQEKKPAACPDQLLNVRAMLGIFQGDYSRRNQELAEANVQVYLLQQKVKMLEEAAKPKPEPEAK